MALSANSVFEVRTAGNDTNGGGFVTGAAGTDYSQQDAKNTATGADDSTTDAVANGTTTITSATAVFGTTIVGNIIYLQGGSGALAAGRYQVTARASTTSITVDRTVAAGTGITMNIGGAVLTLGILGSTTATIMVNENKIWIKAGTYTITSASNNISAGCYSKGINVAIEGYQTTRGDLGTPPVIIADGVITTFTFINLFGAIDLVRNISFNGNSRTSSRGVNLAANGIAIRCVFANFTNSGIIGNTLSYAINCIATGCATSSAFRDINCSNCVAHTNTQVGFGIGINGGTLSRCIAYSNTGATTDGFAIAGTGLQIINCTAYANGRDGFRLASATNQILINCIAEDNVAAGINNSTNSNNVQFVNCAAFSNATDFTIGTGSFNVNLDSITYSAGAFTNAGAGDFSLNNTAGGGADLRAAGIPGAFPGGLTTGFLDIGAAQHEDPTPGGGGETSSVF